MNKTMLRMRWFVLSVALVFSACFSTPVYTHFPPEFKGKANTELVKFVIPLGKRISLGMVDSERVRTDASGTIYLSPGLHKLFLQHLHSSGHAFYERGSYRWMGGNYLEIEGNAGDVFEVVPAGLGKLRLEKR